MPIRMQRQEGRSCPLVICDWCEQPITDARLGMYAWLIGTDGGLPEQGAVYFLHKPCSWAFERAHPGPWVLGWEELRVLPRCLGDTRGLDGRGVWAPRHRRPRP